MDIRTDLARLLIDNAHTMWDRAMAYTDSQRGWVQDSDAVEALALAHHNANHHPADTWGMGASPALYGAVRRELVAQDYLCHLVETKRLADRSRRLQREAQEVGQTALAF